MTRLGFDRFHLIGHDRGVRVGLRLTLDHPERVVSLTNFGRHAVPGGLRTDGQFPRVRLVPLASDETAGAVPETLIGNSARDYLGFLFDRWTAVEGAITPEAYAEYWRCFSDPEMIRGSCADYRAVELDLQHDDADRDRKLDCPVLVLWAGHMRKPARLADGRRPGHADGLAGAGERRAR